MNDVEFGQQKGRVVKTARTLGQQYKDGALTQTQYVNALIGCVEKVEDLQHSFYGGFQ